MEALQRIRSFESVPRGSQRPSIGVYGVPPARSCNVDVAPEGALETPPPAFTGFTLEEWTSIDITDEPSDSPSDSATDSGAAAANAHLQHPDEDGVSVDLGLIGPVMPLIGRLSLLHVGSSTLLAGHSLGFVRFLQVAAAIATVIAAIVPARGTRDFSIVFPAVLVGLVSMRRVALLARFGSCRTDLEAVIKQKVVLG